MIDLIIFSILTLSERESRVGEKPVLSQPDTSKMLVTIFVGRILSCILHDHSFSLDYLFSMI